jgi:molecular chaperone Hsp33
MTLPNKGTKLDIEGAVGAKGRISVIKDLGLKEPYTGNSELVKGDIASDFAVYFTLSEQKPSAIMIGEYYDGISILACGGLFVQRLAGCDDFLITAVQDALEAFTDFGRILYEHKDADAVIKKYFGGFYIKKIAEYEPRFACSCGDGRAEDIIRLIGKKEAGEIIEEIGKIEVRCDFCGKKHEYSKEDVYKLFN